MSFGSNTGKSGKKRVRWGLWGTELGGEDYDQNITRNRGGYLDGVDILVTTLGRKGKFTGGDDVETPH